MAELTPKRATAPTSPPNELAKAIYYAATVLALGMVALGLLIGRPWASPQLHELDRETTINGDSSVTCIAHRWQLDCGD